MTEQILWGKHPQYADGNWIKLARGDDKNEYRFRKKKGFVLKYVKVGQHPLDIQGVIFRENPYSKQKGFVLRVYRAEQAIKKLGLDPFAYIYICSFNNCFEMGDGDAVVWALIHKAHQEPDEHGQSLLTKGIQQMFSRTLNGMKYPKEWLDVYHKRTEDEGQLELSFI